LMAMEVHDALGHDMDHFIKECAYPFHNGWSKDYSSLSFCIHFCKQCVSIVFQHALTFAIERKIALTSDACSRPPLLLDLMICMHATIEGLWVKQLPTMKGTNYLPFFFFFGSCGCLSFGLPFLSSLWWFQPLIFYWIFISTLPWLLTSSTTSY
jgi:hypothetical protein